MHADAVIGSARAKSQTLMELSMKGCQLGDQMLAYMLTHLPPIAVDLKYNGNILHLVAASPVKSVNYSRVTIPAVISLQAFPTYLMQLDLSDSVFQGQSALVGALGRLSGPIALCDLNVARSSFQDSPGKD